MVSKKNTKIAMNNLGLYGIIGGANSDPSISSANADRLRKLDNQLKVWGYKPIYTSSMGGTHAGGVKGHGGGQKIDWVLPNGQQLTPAQAQWMVQNGYWGGNTGALGWHNAGSGFHYDTYIGDPTNPYNSVIGGAIMENRPAPDLINPTGNIVNTAQGGLLNQAAIANKLMELSRQQQAQYNIAAARNEEARRMAELANQGVQDVNTQMNLNRLDPETKRALLLNNAVANQGAINNAANIANIMMEEYYKTPTTQEMQDLQDKAAQGWLDKVRQDNPILANLQNQQLQGYQIDPQKLNQMQALDRSTQNYMASRALMDARVAPERAAIEAQLAQRDPGNAARYAQNAQMLYQMQLANQYGVPYEDLMKAVEMQQKIYEQATPGMISSYKEAMLQPERNRIAAIEQFPKQANVGAANQLEAGQQLQSGLTDEDKLNIMYNTPGANIREKALEQVGKMETEYPELVQKKFETANKPLAQMVEPMVRGNTNITTTTSDNIQKAASDINKGKIAEYEEQGKDARAQLQYLQEMEKLQTKVEQAKKTGDLSKVIKDMDKFIFDKDRNKYPPEIAIKVLKEAGVDGGTAAQIIAHYYPETVVQTTGQVVQQGGQVVQPTGEQLGPTASTVQKTLNTQAMTPGQYNALLNTLNPIQKLQMLQNGMVEMPKGYGSI